MESRQNSCIELIAAFYINSFIILRPLLTKYSYISTYILGIEIGVLVIVYLFNCKFRLDRSNTIRMFGVVLIVTALFLIDFIFRRNMFTWQYYYYFLIYGGLTAVFFINIKDYGKLLEYWTIFAIISGGLVLLDPFNEYTISGSYMDFGTAILPAFAASIIAYAYYKKKLILPLLLVFLLEIILYANKGATFSAIGIILFFTIYMTEDKQKRIKRVVLILGLSIILMILFPTILKSLVKLSAYFGVGSYSLSDVNQILTSGGQLHSYSVRTDIWDNIGTELKKNLITGLGIGGFEVKYGNYAHNFFLDILITHGILIGFCVFIMIAVFIKNTIKCRYKERFIFSSVILLLWILPLMFSFTYWKTNYFWLFIIINIYHSVSKDDMGDEYESTNTYI